MMRFFEPTSPWLAWFVRHAAGRPVVECGCGDGHTLMQLHARGVRAMGVDPRYRDIDVRDWPKPLRSCLMPCPAEELTLLRSPPHPLVVLFCRPCHDGFVGRTILGSSPLCEAVYVSKPDNLDVDLPVEQFSVDELPAPVCKVEKTYRVTVNRV